MVNETILAGRKPVHWLWAAVLACLGAIYVLRNLLLPEAVSPGINLYLIQPILWLALAGLSFFGWRGISKKIETNWPLILTAAIFGIFQMAVLFLAGVFTGYGDSPYSHQLLPLFGNLFYVGSMLLGLELSRAFLGGLTQRHPFATLLLLSVLFSLIAIPFGAYSRFTQPINAFDAIGRLFIPTLAENLLATFLVLIGGPLASIAYLGAMQTIEWLAPFLPDLPLLEDTFLRSLLPILGLIAMYKTFLEEPPDEEKEKEQTGQSPAVWLVIGFLALGLMWLNMGAFGMKSSLVSGPSMTPILNPGDIVITRQISPELVEVGDVIRFRMGKLDVIHRVVDIQRNGESIVFITQGDYNDTEDPPVTAENLEGKLLIAVPKIGWVSIFLRRALAWVL